jgi:cytoskeleton protein RodZ
MTSIGDTLRRERQRRNLELDQVSRELKISSRFLEAIEQENFERLPAGMFAKSFVRQYARLLGLDEEEAANEVERALAPPLVVPQFAAGAQPEIKAAPLPDFYVPKVESWQHVGDGRGFSWSSPLPALALVVVAMLGCSLVYGWWQRSRHPVTTAMVPAHSQAQPAPAAPAKTETAPAADQMSQPVAFAAADSNPASPEAPAKSTASVTPPAQAPITAPVTAGAGGPVKVAVTAEEPVWILARTDGKYSFSGTLEANETRTVEAESTVLLRLGNAGGVTITLNGKSIGEVGPKGQVRTVQLTSGGFQIVAPKPSAPVGDPI